jgi:plasmid maintenance system antidote protein VapI
VNVSDIIYKTIEEKCLKQSAVARAAGYSPKQFNAMLKGRKRMTSDDVVPICKALGVTPNQLFGMETSAAVPQSDDGERWAQVFNP